MPQGVIDILASDIRTVGQSDFVCDPTVADVAVNNVAAPWAVMFKCNGASKLELGDNILIRKIWAVIPFGFGAGGIAVTTFLHLANFSFWDGAILQVIPGIEPGLVIPTLCDPVDFGDGMFVQTPATGARRQIVLSDIRLRVSQIFAPGILAGARIPVQYYMEIQHTYGMFF